MVAAGLRRYSQLGMSRWSAHGGCSSAGRAPGCGPGGRGFESRHSPQVRGLHGAYLHIVCTPCRPLAVKDYRRDYRLWIEPAFGERTAERFTQKDVRAWVERTHSGKLRPGADGSPCRRVAESVASRHWLLYSIYDWAVAPVQSLVTPKPDAWGRTCPSATGSHPASCVRTLPPTCLAAAGQRAMPGDPASRCVRPSSCRSWTVSVTRLFLSCAVGDFSVPRISVRTAEVRDAFLSASVSMCLDHVHRRPSARPGDQ